uniref:Uncharacterized protein n=1 Tax=Arundo donax TaxID=35708 RepID=A0A0A9CPG4_ARUDO
MTPRQWTLDNSETSDNAQLYLTAELRCHEIDRWGAANLTVCHANLRTGRGHVMNP